MNRPTAPSPPLETKPDESVPEQIAENIDGVMAFYRREETKISDSQRFLASVGRFMGRPAYLGSLLTFIALWIFINMVSKLIGYQPIDPPPFAWLQGIVAVGALLTTTIVVITQSREAKLEEQRLELELQVNLLTEQKTTKLIHLLEELRRDLPMVKDRHDPEVAALQEPTDVEEVLVALESRNVKD